jgi:hypothetical protein
VATQTAVPALPQPTLSLAEGAKQGAEPVKKPKKRTRRTSQARDKDGTYLPAGTRKRKITEGKKKEKK